MQTFFMKKNIIPITTAALVLGAITFGNVVQQKSIIEAASAQDEELTLPDNEPMGQEPTNEPLGTLLEPQITEEAAPEELAPMDNMDAHELPNTEEMANPDEPMELPTGYDEGFDAQMDAFPSGMQVIHTSFAANASESTLADGPDPVEPPDPTDPHREKKWSGKRGSAKGQMDALPPVITMDEQPEDGGLTNVTRGYQPE